MPICDHECRVRGPVDPIDTFDGGTGGAPNSFNYSLSKEQASHRNCESISAKNMPTSSEPFNFESHSYVSSAYPSIGAATMRNWGIRGRGTLAKGIKTKQVSLLVLFSFSDTTDKLLMFMGTLGAFGAGVLRPILVLLYGNIINEFGGAHEGDTSTLTLSSVHSASLNFAVVGIVGFIAAYLQVYCWSLTASRQSKRIRSLYVNAIVTKEVGWLDVNDPMQLSSSVADSTLTIQDGMGAKMSDLLHFTSTLVSGIAIAMIKV
ncbi:unnamed protein product [Phytophthora fragariaefolia]|uniref:Unnamed protein product n=1 Tax=Phytophthora fragariaefolia TaxID=1490495 RepID=A0A9W6WY33_9STRA|nr:unnamed protein product [Phytophthora fragariaefolia]